MKPFSMIKVLITLAALALWFISSACGPL